MHRSSNTSSEVSNTAQSLRTGMTTSSLQTHQVTACNPAVPLDPQHPAAVNHLRLMPGETQTVKPVGPSRRSFQTSSSAKCILNESPGGCSIASQQVAPPTHRGRNPGRRAGADERERPRRAWRPAATNKEPFSFFYNRVFLSPKWTSLPDRE